MGAIKFNNSEKLNPKKPSLFGGRISRRTFLKTSLATAAVALIGGAFVRSFLTKPSTIDTLTLRAPLYTQNGKSLIALVKCDNRIEGINTAISLLGGLDPLIKDLDSYVLIKPNCNTAHPFPASTHPTTLETTLELLIAAGVSADDIVVSDLPNAGALPVRTNFHQKGFMPILEKFGVSARFLDEEPEDTAYTKTYIPAATYWNGEFTTMSCVHEASRVISLPALKTHSIGVFTMALKNSVGVLSYPDRRRLHSGNTRQKIAEINLAYSTDLIIVDGLESFVDGGPTYGTKQQTGVVIAGSDRVAVDLVGASVLKFFDAKGLTEKPVCRQDQIQRAKELGIGNTERDKIILRHENLNGDSSFEDMINLVFSEME